MKKQNKIFKNLMIKSLNVILLMFFMFLCGGLIYHYFTNDQIKPNNLNTEELQISQETDCLNIFFKKKELLNRLIEIKEEELKDTNLAQTEKDVLEKILKLKKQEREEIQNLIDVKNYLKNLKEESKIIEKKIKKEKLSLEEKHRLTEEKINKEKEFLKYQKLLLDKENTTQIIQGLDKKLAHPELSNSDKTTFNNEKNTYQQQLKTLNEEIKKVSQIIQIKKILQDTKKELENPDLSLELKEYLQKYQTLQTAKLEELEKNK